MLGLDVSETTTVTLADTAWTLGLLPLAKNEELVDAVDDAHEPFRTHVRTHLRPDETMDNEALANCEECSRLLTDATRQLRPTYREAVRWGLRSCDRLALETEVVPLVGKAYAVLTADFVQRLSRVGNGRLVQQLAVAVLDANRLNAREVLGFK
jgi:hypothetical protein